jgi:alkylation response protein AidB-like acyl-CoA dehydrogenase
VASVAASAGVVEDRSVRQLIARLATREMIQRWLVYRVRTALVQGRPPGPEASILKLVNSHQVEEVGNALVDVLGAQGMLSGGDAADAGRWQDMFLFQWSSRIGGGTEQVQRNILAERVLGLPREPDPFKGVPWNQLPKG